MTKEAAQSSISQGFTSLGIELGSTRIKAVLIDPLHQVLAAGEYEWENELIDGVWTYSLEDVWTGIRASYAALVQDVFIKYHCELHQIGSIGISAMMHGYLAFDKADELLVPFRTWRNVSTEKAAAILTEKLAFHIPERWSISHLYQAILDQEKHVSDIDFITTLAGYVHWQLTGQKVLGIGDASGMFPIDVQTKNYAARMLAAFQSTIAEKNYPWKVTDILPKVLLAGDDAGVLTAAGVELLDSTGKLQAGIPCCPPEGDAGTGMVATNSVAKKTGNVSAGTSIFAMIVLEQALNKVYPEIDVVTTPIGDPVAMVHANNCSSDINAWMKLFNELLEIMGSQADRSELFEQLFTHALLGEADCGKLLSYCYYSGETITKMPEGRPLFVRQPDSHFNLANFVRMQIYSAFAVLKTGMDILQNEEKITIEKIYGHGGLFKTAGVAQRFLAAAINTPVTVMSTAGEGGAWGMAVLAAYQQNKLTDQSLSDYLDNQVFAQIEAEPLMPQAEDVAGFAEFSQRYTQGLPIEQAAIKFFE